jgi:FlaA1/EpsC-like NDP-sugar epimerase
VRRFIVFTDALSILGGGLLSYWLRFGTFPDPAFARQVLFASAITVTWLAALGLYGRRGTKLAEQLGRGILAITAGLVSALVVAFFTDVYLSRTWFALTWMLAVALFVMSRVTWQVGTARPAPQ